MKTDYFYGKQTLQFNFIKLPKILFQDSSFDGLSLPSKVLYGFLLERVALSVQNGWFDDENRAYVIYQISEIQEDLGYSKPKAIEFLAELEKAELVEKKRRGLGLPNVIYVKNFIFETSRNQETEPLKPKNLTLRTKKYDLRSQKIEPLKNKTNKNKTNKNKTNKNNNINIYNNIYNKTPLTPLGEKETTKTQEHNFDKHTNVENLEYILEQGLSNKADVILGDEMLKGLIVAWVGYKDERKPRTNNHYAKTGLCCFLTSFIKKYNEYGYEKVKQVVEDSIANNYQGIVWDWLEKKPNSNSYMQTMRDRVSVVDSWV